MASSQIGVSSPQRNKKCEENARQHKPSKTKLLYQRLKEKLEVRLGMQPKVRRTVSSFEELCPEWSKRSNQRVTPIETAALHHLNACAVGEAWGWSAKYSSSFLYAIIGCRNCNILGSKFSEALYNEDRGATKLDTIKADLVKHWNEKHGRK